MKREWIVWKKQVVIWLGIFGGIIVAVLLGWLDYEKYGDWWYRHGVMDMQARVSADTEVEEVHTVFFQTMMSNIANHIMMMFVPALLVCVSFGKDITSQRFNHMKENQMSSQKLYVQSFGMNSLLAFALAVVGIVAQMIRLREFWLGLSKTADFLFWLRILSYVCLVTLFTVAVAQFASLFLSEIFRFAPLIVVGLGMMGVIRIGFFNQIQTYLCWDMPQGVLNEPYILVISDPGAAQRWGLLFLLGLTGMTFLLLAAGCFIIKVKYETSRWKQKPSLTRTDEELLSRLSLTVIRGETSILAGCEEERVRILFSVLAGNVVPNRTDKVEKADKADKGKAYFGKKKIGSLIEQPFFYERLDVRENLYAIQSLQRREQRKTKEEIEELLTLTGLNGIGNRGRSLASYSDGMKCRYGIAVALLTNPDILILEGVLDGMGQEDTRLVREVLLQLKEKGIAMLLSTSDKEAEKWEFGQVILG